MIQQHEIPGLAVIVKVVGKGCNLNCQYCFYAETERKQTMLMTDEILRLIIEEGISTTSQYTGFYWHGGEPLIPGIKFYKRAVALQEEYHQRGKGIENMIQTNGTLITPEWAQFFKDYDFRVGLSLDGTPEFHDALRKDWSGKGTYRKILQGIEALQKAGVRFGVIVVLTSLTKGLLPNSCFDSKLKQLMSFELNFLSFGSSSSRFVSVFGLFLSF